MLAFYRDTRADDCDVERDGDMLLFQWGTNDLHEVERFELDLTRQFIAEGAEDDDIWQLSLTFVFPPAAMQDGDRWCGSPAELQTFAAFVLAHEAYAAFVEAVPQRVELDFESVG